MLISIGNKHALFLKQARQNKSEKHYQKRRDKSYSESQKKLNSVAKEGLHAQIDLRVKTREISPWHQDVTYAETKKVIDATQSAPKKMPGDFTLTTSPPKKMYPWQQLLLFSAISSVITTKPEHESLIHKRLAEKMMRMSNEKRMQEWAQHREERAASMKKTESRYDSSHESCSGTCVDINTQAMPSGRQEAGISNMTGNALIIYRPFWVAQPLSRSKRNTEDLMTSNQLRSRMSTAILNTEQHSLLNQIDVGLAQLLQHLPQENKASEMVRYSLLRHIKTCATVLLKTLGKNHECVIDMTTLLGQVDYSLAMYERSVPKKLHMVWIGGLGEIEMEYMRSIVQNAQQENYRTTLWYDPEATLVATLGKKIKEFSVLQNKDFINTAFYSLPTYILNMQRESVVGNVLALQNLAYTEIKMAMASGRTFDEGVIEFMVHSLGEERTALLHQRDRHLASYQRVVSMIRDMLSNSETDIFSLRRITSDLFSVSDTSPESAQLRFNSYLMELGLRNNLAAASDIVRASVLYQEGGVYLDSDILPNLRQDIFAHLDVTFEPYLKSMSNQYWKMVSVAIKYEAVLEQLDTLFPARVERRPHYDNFLDMFLEYGEQGRQHVASLRAAVKSYSDAHIDDALATRFFEPLAAISVGPLDLGMAHVDDGKDDFIFPRNNNVLAAQPKSEALLFFIEKMRDMHAFMHEFNHVQFPFLRADWRALTCHENFGDFADVDRQSWRNRHHLPPASNGKEVLHDLPGFRFDGLLIDSKSTVFVSGPSALYEAMSDYALNKIGEGKYLEIDSALNVVGAKNHFDAQNSLLQTRLDGEWSEEALISGWLDEVMKLPYPQSTTTNYDMTIILQLDREAETNYAARFLNNKHHNKMMWVQLIKNQNNGTPSSFSFRMINGVPGVDWDQAKVRVTVLGHTDVVGGEIKLSGLNAYELAHLFPELTHHIQSLLNEAIVPAWSAARISLVGCDLAKEAQGERGVVASGFVADLFAGLRAERFVAHDITARKGAVIVRGDGKKFIRQHTGARAWRWAHGEGETTKYIFTHGENGAVNYQAGTSTIEGPLVYLMRPPGGAGPLGWGETAYQKTAAYLADRFSLAIERSKARHHLEGEWIPLLDTMDSSNTMTWIDKQMPTVSRDITVEDPVFKQIKAYLDQHLATLKESHQFVDDQFFERDQMQEFLSMEKNPVTKISKAERSANAFFAINTLIDALNRGTRPSAADAALTLKLHGYLAVTQATQVLTEEGLEASEYLSRLLLRDQQFAVQALSSATKFSHAVGRIVGPIFNFGNLGFDIAQAIQAQGTDQAGLADTQLGFDVAMTTAWMVGQVGAALGFDAVAVAAGPVGWALMAVDMFVMLTVGEIQDIKHAHEERLAINHYFEAMQAAYRAGGMQFDKQNHTLVALPSAIVTGIDLVRGEIALASATLSKVIGIKMSGLPMHDTYTPFPSGIVPVLDSSVDGRILAQSLSFPLKAELLPEQINGTHIIVLPGTPKMRFDYTTISVRSPSEPDYSCRLGMQLFSKKASNNSYFNMCMISLRPIYLETLVEVTLDKRARILVSPPFSPEHKKYLTYRCVAGGGLTTIVPQAGEKFVLISNPQVDASPALWFIDARALTKNRPRAKRGMYSLRGISRGLYMYARRTDSGIYVGSVHISIENPRAGDKVIIQCENGSVQQISFPDGALRFSRFTSFNRQEKTAFQLLNHFALEHQTMPYVAVSPLLLTQFSDSSSVRNEVSIFDSQRRRMVPACLSEDAGIAGVDDHQDDVRYFFASQQRRLLWRVDGETKRVAAQYDLLVVKEAAIVGVSVQSGDTLVEQRIAIPLAAQFSLIGDVSNAPSVRIFSTITPADTVVCHTIVFPVGKINQQIDMVKAIQKRLILGGEIHRDALMRALFEANGWTVVGDVDAHLHIANDAPIYRTQYADFLQLNGAVDEDNDATTVSAWVWLSDRSMRVIQPKYQDKSGQSVPGPNIVKMLSVDNVPIAFSDSGLMYRVQEDDQLELMGTTQAWVKLHWASLAVDLNTLASHYAAAASITLDGFSGQYLVPNRLHERASPPIDAPLSKAVRAWYDVIANQFMIAPAELQQTNLLYVGSDGQRGGWLYDRELGQLSHSDLVTPTLARLFIDESLQSKVVNWQVARHVLDGQFVSDAVRREDGRVLATSAEGIVFLIDAEELGVAGQGPLLLGVNAIWCQAHQATLHHDLEQLCIRYASMGKIYVMNQDTSGAAQFWSCTSNRFAA